MNEHLLIEADNTANDSVIWSIIHISYFFLLMFFISIYICLLQSTLFTEIFVNLY